MGEPCDCRPCRTPDRACYAIESTANESDLRALSDLPVHPPDAPTTASAAGTAVVAGLFPVPAVVVVSVAHRDVLSVLALIAGTEY